MQSQPKLIQNWNLEQIVQPGELIDDKDPEIEKVYVLDEDILRMICQYLQDKGYYTAAMTIRDESSVKAFERMEVLVDIKRMKKAILEGDWVEVDRLGSKPFMKGHKSFLYAAYEQQYLEYIEHHEIQKAFTHLNKRLKPLEHLQRTPTEFRELCYLLTSKSVQDVYKNWEGMNIERQKLVELFQGMMETEINERERSTFVPPDRLVTLLRQAVAYQVESARYHPSVTPRISSLLQDFTPLIVPNAVKTVFNGHTKNVKCASFLGKDGIKMMTGGSDYDCRVWKTETGECLGILSGHTSRIWDISSSMDGSIAVSASGDATIKVTPIHSGLGYQGRIQMYVDSYWTYR
jgi:COMPASS component SWD3